LAADEFPKPVGQLAHVGAETFHGDALRGRHVGRRREHQAYDAGQCRLARDRLLLCLLEREPGHCLVGGRQRLPDGDLGHGVQDHQPVRHRRPRRERVEPRPVTLSAGVSEITLPPRAAASGAKAYLHRQVGVFARRAFVVDVKREYGAVDLPAFWLPSTSMLGLDSRPGATASYVHGH